MIRQNASIAKCKKVVVLDPFIVENEELQNNSDLLIEGFLGIVKDMFLSEYEVTIGIYKESKWKFKIINKISDIEEIQRSFSEYTFCKEEASYLRFNKFFINEDEKYDLIIVTSNKDIEIENFIKNIKDKCHGIEIIRNNKEKILEEEFYLEKDYVLERI